MIDTEQELTPAQVMERCWRAWRDRDKRTLLSLFADNAVFALCIPEDVVPFGGGAVVGKPAISDRLQTILDQFETSTYVATLSGVDGDTARGIVRYAFRHKATGEEIEGTMRHIAVIRDGLIVDFKEIHDIEKIRAFMRLVAYAAAENG